MATILHIPTMALIPSQHGPDFQGPEFLVDPDLSAVEELPMKFWKVVDGAVVPMTELEQTAVLLAEAKVSKAADIDAWYNGALMTGYDTGNGYHLAATVTDQTRFTQDAVLQQQLLDRNEAVGSDMVGFLDSTYSPRALSLDNYISLLVSYGSWCRSKLLERATLLGQVAAATTLEDVEAITPGA